MVLSYNILFSKFEPPYSPSLYLDKKVSVVGTDIAYSLMRMGKRLSKSALTFMEVSLN